MQKTNFALKVFAYLELMKPRVMSLVIFTAFVGMFLAQTSFNIEQMLTPLFCITLASGASASLNMWYDADIDSLMERTKLRPIPSGTISRNEALFFGISLSIVSVGLMKFLVNDISAFLLVICIVYYVVIYTVWLKRITVQNIVIGGAAGAIPPIIGCSAVSGTISFESLLLFAIVFFWTPPHFWSLSLSMNADYKRANIPMMAVIRGDHETKINIMVYSVILVCISLVPVIWQMFGIFYLICAACLGLYFLKLSFDLLRNKLVPIFVFKYSIIYLFTLFSVIVIDKIIR